jgi:hypothetical protein
MTASFTSPSSTPPLKSASWCFLLLEHLNEFATLVWYLLADGKLVEDTFARTMTELDRTALDASIPVVAYSRARDLLVTQAIHVLSHARKENDEDQLSQRDSFGSLPDLPRLEVMLRMNIRSSEGEGAKSLSVSSSEVKELAKYPIERFGSVPPISASTGCYDA